jgi:NodT family efflux transporter outer membrane factor (OMF) lipoprotein
MRSNALHLRSSVVAVAAIAVAVSGCTNARDYVANGFKVGPNYCHVQGTTAERWIDEADSRLHTDPVDLTNWWAVFKDPTLNGLIDRAARQNLSLREAGWRVMQARALLWFARGAQFPQDQTLGGNYQRLALSGANYGPPMLPSTFFDQWTLGFNLSWELDFWGRFRRAVTAAEETLNASAADYDAVLVTLLGDVAANYVQVRTLEKRIELLRADAKLQRGILGIAQRRRDAGRVGELDVIQARSNVWQTEAQIPQLIGERREACNRLCVLMGIPPEDLESLLGASPIPTAPVEIAIGVPAELIRRRPDIRRAEYLVAAQAERIGIAEADLYPAFSINGTIGYQARDFSQLFTGHSFAGAVGPGFQWNILNYGRLRALVAFQNARFQELLATYQQTVLRANSEVEDGLVRFLQAQSRTALLDKSVEDYRKAVDIVVEQYENGAIDMTRVSQIQQNLVQQQDLQAQSQGQIALGLIRVYQALGGGWTTEYVREPAPREQPAVESPPLPPAPDEP